MLDRAGGLFVMSCACRSETHSEAHHVRTLPPFQGALRYRGPHNRLLEGDEAKESVDVSGDCGLQAVYHSDVMLLRGAQVPLCDAASARPQIGPPVNRRLRIAIPPHPSGQHRRAKPRSPVISHRARPPQRQSQRLTPTLGQRPFPWSTEQLPGASVDALDFSREGLTFARIVKQYCVAGSISFRRFRPN